MACRMLRIALKKVNTSAPVSLPSLGSSSSNFSKIHSLGLPPIVLSSLGNQKLTFAEDILNDPS